MSRKDHEGRVLERGESQRPDGLYVFSYIDHFGKQKHVYSWRLNECDLTPAGKREKPALRTLETRIKRDLEDDIARQNMTVIELVKDYIFTRRSYVRQATETGYRFVTNLLKKEEFGTKMISSVKMPMAKEFLQDLQRKGRSYSTIHLVRGVLRPAFRRAVEYEWIRKNPFEFPLAGIIVDDSTKRIAISADQERKYLEFVKQDKHFCRYYDAINILFKTGLRISEFCGLTMSDIDLEEKTLTVCRQLQRQSDMTYVIEKPKTDNGNRILPLTESVCNSFRRIIDRRKKPSQEPTIDGVSGFLCLDKNGWPMVAYHWEKYFQHICKKYNQIYKAELPKITPHVCRHTYCTNMAKSGINPVYLSYLMGHSDKEITLNVYTTIKAENSFEDIRKAVTSAVALSAKNPYFSSVLN